MQEDCPGHGISAVIRVAALSVIVVSFGSAFARRLEPRPSDVASPDSAIGELREELDAVQERLDFLERALVSQRHQGGRALPAQSERGDPIAHTPS
jgi:hypothetical protein